MKHILSVLFLAVLAIGCATEPETEAPDNTANDLFEKNAKTVMTYLESYQNENIDYDALYSNDYVMRPTGQGSPDSLTKAEVMEDDKNAWARNDYEIITDPISLLPGVNADTKLPDGSVRYYGVWKITKSATDSTEETSAYLKLYESFDFDDEGKIVFQQYYGDFGGLRKALNPEM